MRKTALVLLCLLAVTALGCRADWIAGEPSTPDLKVIATSPSNGQTNVSQTAQIVIRTSVPLDPQYVIVNPSEPWKNSQIILVDQSNQVLPVAYSFNGEYLTVAPLSPFGAQATYGVAIRPGARDIYGKNISVPYAFTFATGSILSAIPNWPPFPAPPGGALPPPPPGTFQITGLLNIARHLHEAIMLDTGKVLITGGTVQPGGAVLRSAEIYDPATQAWTLSQSNQANGMFFIRIRHRMVKLLNGRVLITGGWDNTSTWDTVEEYDPLQDTFSLLQARLQRPRTWHTAVLMPNGNPIIIGGIDATGAILNTMEVYDLKTGTWIVCQSAMGGGVGQGGGAVIGRYGHLSLTMPDYSIMSCGGAWVAGGGTPNQTDDTAELYFPDYQNVGTQGNAQFTGTFMACGRDQHTATLITSGQGQGMVIVIGGERYDYVFSNIAIDTFEVYDHSQFVPNPSMNGQKGAWTPGASPMFFKRAEHTANLLKTGKILVVGGFSFPNQPAFGLRSAELMNPFALGYTLNAPWAGIDQTAKFDWTRDPQGNQTQLSNLITGLGQHTATTLKDGRVLIAGGCDFIPPFGPPLSRNLAWLYHP